jgi:hypothetical protein
MDANAFWKIIDETRSAARDDQDFLDKIAARLREMSPDELEEFEEHFNRIHQGSYARPLWGAAYLINGGCSDDGFEYFRAWLMAQGRETFEKAIHDPDSLATIDDPEGELEKFMYVACEVYETKTGHKMPDTALQGAAYPDLGEAWDFDDADEMKKRYPELFAIYGWIS